ncbi:alpha/beta hydrolase [Subtercola lobariae]|uniref:Esterase n=1 Tax=Subtercola lobariae TaxID=1588641 RepID=A0A917B765_9MICO|nr:alpha/beta hydrolase-fold protein [Subtercola lobariae]GGF24696.1 esterase [Subtercola lobariae]
MGSFGTVSIVAGAFVVIVYAVAAVCAAYELAVRPGPRWSRRRWSATSGIALLAGAAIGLVAAWIVTGVLDLFGVDLSLAALVWVAVGFAFIAVCVCSFVGSRWPRTVISAIAIVVFAGTTAMSLNIDIGTYTTVNSVFGISPFAANTLPNLATPTSSADDNASLGSTWVAPRDQPAAGLVSEVKIPGVVSGFVARHAVVYLPPAALTEHPPALPVVIALSGQPGQPSDPLVSAHLIETLNSYAAAHHGLAPIVVSPDQLGDPDNNPMCVDGALGNSATYLTVDVVDWIAAHLPVAHESRNWGISGFSQGGTCSIQLGAAHPELFGAILDVSGELVPANGDEANTISVGFAGDRAAYLAACPENILRKHTPFASTFAVFAVGSDDDIFRPFAQQVSRAAHDAGMSVTYFEAPGSAHDYTTATYSFARGMTLLGDHFGLGS